MTKADPIIYKDWNTYLDPEHLPSKKNLAIRGIIDLLPLVFLSGFASVFVAAPLSAISREGALLAMGLIIVGFPAVVHFKNAKDNKKEFIAAGGNPSRYGYWSYAGMLPMGQKQGEVYKFATPQELVQLKENPHYTIDTRDRVFF